jgi:hypothetical protein
VEAVAKNDSALAEQEMAQHIMNMVEAIRVKYQIDVAID